MRKKGSYRKNKLFCLLAAAALRFVQSYLNDIAHRGSISKGRWASANHFKTIHYTAWEGKKHFFLRNLNKI